MDLQRDDITAIAIFIYRAKRDGRESIEIPIQGFIFYCEPTAGVIKQNLHQVGSINQKLGEGSVESYLYSIQRGLMLAAKIYLLLELQKQDRGLAAVININIERGTNLDEQSVNQIVGRIIQPKGSTLTTLVGIFAAKPISSPFAQTVREELSKAAWMDIHSFADAESIYKNITAKLSPQRATPESHHR